VHHKPSYALYCAVIVSIGGFVFGFDASVISGVVGFVATEFDLTPIQSGFVVAAPTASGLAGTMLAGPLSDVFGRRKILMVVAFLYVLSALASAFATSYLMLVAARAIGGLAFTSLMLAPLYIGEIAPPAARGRAVSINQLNIVVGLSAAYFTNYFLLKLSGTQLDWVVALGIDTQVWRWMLGIEILPAAIFFLMLFTIPDTPRWLMLKGREAEATRVVETLLPAAEAAAEIEVIRHSSATRSESVWRRIGDIFGTKMRLALLVGLVVAVAQQITGINAIFFYAPTIFEQSGIGTNAAFSQAVMVGLINVVFTVVAMALIDRWGRKPLLVLGLLGIVASMGVCSWGFATAQYRITPPALAELEQSQAAQGGVDTAALRPLVGQSYASDVAFKRALKAVLGEQAVRDHQSELLESAIQMNPILILVGILGFVASFAVSLGPVMWVLFSEIFPTQLRGVAVSFVGFVNSTVSFFVQLVFPVELDTLGAAATFAIYGAFALLGLVLVLRLLPETRGLSLEELEAVFGHGQEPAGH
jgi:sugar porter (SP) family MFS transporter